ncbi:hypothetical protein ACIRBX_29265 [Kitasatospora sp. NPDC096147]|uniref:hypothetical protein n=1 Tax=Kitasatospora sp. NPDC096147 TaxID=3364093 RepID=UPI0037F5C9D6
MNDEQLLAARLGELAAEPAPEAKVSVVMARTAGRERLRRRRLAGAAGAVAVLVAAGVLGFGLREGGDGAPVPSVSPTTGPSSLISNVRFGWLPDDATASRGYRIEGGQAFATAQVGENPLPTYSLTLTPAGSKPGARLEPLQFGVEITEREAPRVNGRPASWLSVERFTGSPTERTYLLRWQVAGGRWAELLAEYLPDRPESEQEVLRIAATAVFEAVEVALPVRIGRVGGSVRFSDSELVRQAGPYAGRWTLTMPVELDGRTLSLQVRRHRPEGSPGSQEPFEPGTPLNAECRVEEWVSYCLGVPEPREPTAEERPVLRKVLDGIEPVPGFA